MCWCGTGVVFGFCGCLLVLACESLDFWCLICWLRFVGLGCITCSLSFLVLFGFALFGLLLGVCFGGVVLV